MDLTGPPRYIRLRVLETKKLDIGDIVKLFNTEDSVLGKVTDFSEDFILLNNSNAVFMLRDENPGNTWQYEILYSDFDK